MAGERAAKDSAIAKDGGSPVATPVRAPIEASFGASLGHVRVHSGGSASARVDSAGARAFTYGPNIFLGSGQSSTDVALMAHESAHVVQQGSGSRTMQFAGTGVANRFESEAEQASAAVLAGAAFPVRERTGGAVRQFSWFSRAVSAVGGAVSSAVSAVGNVAGAIRDRVLRFIGERVSSIPGFDLLTVILGRNPVTGQPVERSAVNLIRGFMGLIPGGAALFEKIQQTQIIQRAYEWFSQEIPKLNLTWDAIVALFRRAWDSLSAGDLLNPGGVFERMRGIFGAPLSRLANFALAAGNKLLEFVVEGALKIAGDAGGRVMALVRRGGSVLQRIINDPVAFGRNLMAAVSGGFGRFRSNIGEHLRNGLIGWLTGALTGAGLRLPRSFTDWRGIIAMVLDIIGLTYQLFRRLLVRAIGEERVRFLEGVFDFLRILVTQGLGAAWEKIREYASNLTDMVIGGIRSWVERTVVGQAITRLLSLLSPVGALIQTAIAIYNTVMFFVERIQQIMQLASSVFDSIANIASGNISGAITYVEQAMARTLPVIISFLARLVGLGGISERIREIITRIRTAVESALTRVVDWIVARVRGLIAGRSAGQGAAQATPMDDPTGVKARALAALTQQLTAEHTGPQIQAIVQSVHQQLRPAGLRRLDVGRVEQDGSFDILAEASKYEVLTKVAPKGRQVRMVTTLQVKGNPLPAGVQPFAPNPRGATDPALGNSPIQVSSLPPTTTRYGQQGASGGYVIQPQPSTPGQVQVLTWNTGADEAVQGTGTSHAENHFALWFESHGADWIKRVERISIRINRSPCGSCASESLVHLLTRRFPDGPVFTLKDRVQSGLLHAEIVYDSPHTGKNPTTVGDIDAMQRAGWSVSYTGTPVTLRQREVASIGDTMGQYSVRRGR